MLSLDKSVFVTIATFGGVNSLSASLQWSRGSGVVTQEVSNDWLEFQVESLIDQEGSKRETEYHILYVLGSYLTL